MKTIIIYILTFPQILICKVKRIKEDYTDLVSFFRYFPFGKINKDRTISFRFNGKKVNFFYGDLKPITAGIFKNGEYKNVNVKDRVVVDIGAATGDTAIYFILRGATKVYGYELNKRSYDIAQKNIDLNNLRDKVNIEYCGVASKKIKSSDTILGAIIPTQDRKDVDGANVKTLDEIVKEHNIHNAVLKVDTDGFEYDIFNTVKEETLQAFDMVVLEYHFGTKEIPNKLEKCGFKVKIGKATKTHVAYHPKEYKDMEVGMIYAIIKN